MKKKLKKILVMIMALVMCINTMGMNVIATEVSEVELTDQEVPNVEETVEEVSTEVVETGAWDGVTKENSFEGEGFQVTFSLVEYWDTGFNATIKIDNTGENVIENWCLSYEFSNAISNIWNAEIFDQKETVYTIKNVGWNQDIAVGESVEFGISSNEGFQGFPKDYKLLGENGQTNEEDYTVEYNWDNDWETGFQGTVSITNNTESIIEDWTIEFDFENEITDIWDAEIISHEDNHYVIHNAGYNKDINANGTVTFGIVVNEGVSAKEIYNISLTKYVMEDVTEPEREPEPLEDIGEAYFKEPTEDDVVINEETGIMYIKNQVLVSALPGAPKEAFEEIAEYIGADIVGYIELTNDYQFEFQEDKTAEELDNMIAYLNSFSFVSYVSLNLYEANCTEITRTNDYLYRDNVTYIEKDDKLESIPMEKEYSNGWNEDIPDGDNWGLEALKILSAWDLKAKFKPVKVGVYDNSFARHTDIRYDYVFNGTLNDVSDHGTRVAGVLAAQMNNNKGISGIVTDADLYAYATEGTGSSMGSKHAYATLIGNHVKVINVSLGEPIHIQYAASHGNKKAQNYITQGAAALGEFLEKLIKQGYDFVIVTSAGNAETVKVVVDDSLVYGYRDLVDGESKENLNLVSGGINPFYNCPLTAITQTSVKDRIIVVAAIQHKPTSSGAIYNYASYSNRGDRVDVCAPGEKILSTVPDSVSSIGYNLGGGTSIASPHIAGVAGLMYQMNPSIRGTQVKEIICNNCYKVTDISGNVIKLPNAKLCVDKAERVYEFSENDNPLPTGVLTGRVVDQKRHGVKGVKVTANRTSVDESNVESYYSTGTTDQFGYFEIIVPEGIYDLSIYAEGYLPYTVNDITIQADETEYVGELALATWVPESLFSKSAGVVIDAMDGMSINGARVRLRKGWNNYSGAYAYNVTGEIREVVTDNRGEYCFDLPAGIYTAEVVKDGYITGYYNVVATIISLANEQTLALTPLLSENEYRIILTWGEVPRDLDSHLTYYVNDEKKMHVFYQNKTGKYNGEVIAKLNLDDVTSYGPETVTLTLNAELLENEVFKYSVHNFTGRSTINSKDLANSNAVIRVYKGNAMIDKIHVPQDGIGNVWHVFDIDKDGIILYNEFYDATSASKVQ